MCKKEDLKAQYKALCSLMREYRTVAGTLQDMRDTIYNLPRGYWWMLKHLKGFEIVEHSLWALIQENPCYEIAERMKYGTYEFCGIFDAVDDYVTGDWVFKHFRFGNRSYKQFVLWRARAIQHYVKRKVGGLPPREHHSGQIPF